MEMFGPIALGVMTLVNLTLGALVVVALFRRTRAHR
jgi:hypothetical protein